MAQELRRQYCAKLEDRQINVDGARQDGGNLLAIAAMDTFSMTRTQCLSTRDKISLGEVELQTILLGIRTLMEPTPRAMTKATIFTNSLEALKAL
ncbi:hypothetical protein HPB47_010717 [Ixodes persulcatus]|uniref:Uncharacterized protein n=1 Tax=Ixodes persulcatus TaxID=34615 RepID=A0AC60NYA6_IXOPE|nr:hypothetical protein HPB47_010717 [Ixodes persulcatus]